MNEIAKAQERLIEATTRGPISNPFGFYLLDRILSTNGMFHWYETEEDMINAIRNDLISLFNKEEDIGSIQSTISNIIDTSRPPHEDESDLLMKLSQFLSEQETWASLEFIGAFDQLCEGNGNWAMAMRQYFRGYNDSEDEMSEEDASLPIPKDKRKEFAEVIASYGQ